MSSIDLVGAAIVTLWIVALVHTLLLVGILRQMGMIQLRLGTESAPLVTPQGLERDTVGPLFRATEARSGTAVDLGHLNGRPTVLFFLTTTCSACKELVGHINAVAREWPEINMLAVCQSATRQATAEFAQAYGLSIPIVADETGGIAKSYDVRFTPFVYLLDEVGRVRIRGIANTWPQLEALLAQEGFLYGRPLVHHVPAAGAQGLRPARSGEEA